MRDFLSVPFAAYQGQYSSQPFNGPAGKQKGLLVRTEVFWPVYNVGGSPLGTVNSQFAVSIDMNIAGANAMPGYFTIQSVFVDNQGVNFPTYVFFPSTKASISCPPNSTGWYQVFTLDRKALVVGMGITDTDIANGVQTNVFFTDIPMVPYLDQETLTAAQLGLASPTISLGGSGGQVSSISVVNSGLWYNNGNLTISGAGGNGAVAQGTLDQFGRFASVAITNGGQGYQGYPVITPTGGQSVPPNWVPGNYGAGTLLSYGGGVYLCWQATAGAPSIPPTGSPFSKSYWSYTGLPAQAQAASFSSAVTSIVGGTSTTSSGIYEPRALGDQARNYQDTVVGSATFRRNLWGTPFASGYIYLTSVDVHQLNVPAGPSLWELRDINNDVLLSFQSSTQAGQLLKLDNCNIRLPANIEWVLACTGNAGNINLSHGFTWTYAQF